MDFDFSEEQTALQELAREILEKEVSLELLKQIEAGDEWFARGVWKHLAEANLLGIAIPEVHGGMGYGLIELCLLLHEVGRSVAPLPALPTLVLGALPLARFGGDEQQRRWLPAVAAGEAILTAALVDRGSSDVERPATRAERDGGGWTLHGVKAQVAFAGLAQRVLVPASSGDGVALFLLDPAAPGVTLTRQETSTHEPLFELELAGARVEEAERIAVERGHLSWLRDCANVAIAATQVGVSQRAFEITTAYVSERVQFGAPIGSFPPVQHRAADAYIDLAALRWTTWRAAWKLAEGQPASREAMVAKFWAAEGGSRIANSAQHLHGGMGVDRDYPVHRYFMWSKSLELCLGGAMPQLARLGEDMARTGPQELS